MNKIKFGTDGWRAIIAQEYTVDNVLRVAEATAKWMKLNKMKKAVIGHDCRFGGELFAEATARMLAAYNIKVQIAKGFVSTPMVSLGVVKTKSDVGIVITASHNPPSYNGFKLKSSLGGPMLPAQIEEIEDLIPNKIKRQPASFAQYLDIGKIKYVALEDMYVAHAEKNFDMKLINKSNIGLAYDAMYGAGMNALARLIPNATMLHCDWNPGMHGQAPEPIHRNLMELSNLIKNDATLKVGLANDGDADRIGLYDEDGNFVDSHHILLMLLMYMHKYKGLNGKVAVTFSVTEKMIDMAEKFKLPTVVTKIGFKYLAEIMAKEDCLVAGEESGGLAVKGHIPERDGIWIGLVVLEYMAKTGKTLKQIIQEVYDVVGEFKCDRYDLHVTEEKKQEVLHKCREQAYKSFGKYKVSQFESVDGFKFTFERGKWVMFRASGTEPVLRVYAQAPTQEEAIAILDAAKSTIL
ncbi:MAG: phosphoglucomutase/phosphomannomutase family protein [Saprospiraceae bacterium]